MTLVLLFLEYAQRGRQTSRHTLIPRSQSTALSQSHLQIDLQRSPQNIRKKQKKTISHQSRLNQLFRTAKSTSTLML